MNAKTLGGSIAIVLVSAVTLGLFFAPGKAPRVVPTPTQSEAPSNAEMRKSYGRIPLSFEANQGQAEGTIQFLARGAGYQLDLSPTKPLSPLGASPTTGHRRVPSLRQWCWGSISSEPIRTRPLRVSANWKAKWRTDIPTFGRVRCEEVYPGIDVTWYGNQQRLEYDFVVAPGRDPAAIALEFAGATALEIEPATGDLLLRVGDETIRQRAPVTYQMAGETRRTVPSRYALREDGRVGFALGEYDPSAPLVIDPVLEYSTYFVAVRAIAVDAAGNAYLTGTNLEGDVIVSKLNATGTALVYSTSLGGTGGDTGYGIAVDAAGSAYVTGRTSSLDFPLLNPIQDTRGGGTDFGLDAFVTKLSPTGDALFIPRTSAALREMMPSGSRWTLRAARMSRALRSRLIFRSPTPFNPLLRVEKTTTS